MNKLKFVALHITKNCSHNCSYCYYRSDQPDFRSIDPENNNFHIENLKAIIDELEINKVQELYLLGGDPAEHPQFYEIVKYAYDKKIIVTSVSNTHEYRCNPKDLSKYLSICESTIHGDSHEFHDEFCGVQGAYDKTLSNLKLYHDLGCTTGITVNVMPSNANILYSIVSNIITNYGEVLQYINIQRIAPNGKAGINDDYYLNRESMLIAFSQIDKISKEYGIEIQCEDAFPLCLIPKKYWEFIHRCEWGYEKLSINGDGNVSRCGADPRYNLGNVLEIPLSKIWNESKLLNEFRNKEFLSPKCHNCSNLDICGGGCLLGTWTGREFGSDYLLEQIK